jgi:hypothetical protein
MLDIPADVSIETAGWLAGLLIALVFVAVIALISYWLK